MGLFDFLRKKNNNIKHSEKFEDVDTKQMTSVSSDVHILSNLAYTSKLK